jgi:Family of unknown function (DUF6529)
MTVAHVGGKSATPAALGVLAAGAAVAVALGVYGSQHTPTGETITTLGFEDLISMKVWLGLVAGTLALLQLVGALWMYGRFGRPAPAIVGPLHRASGFTAILVSLPAAYHCLWSLGFQSYDTRVLLHSLAGCAVYGAVVVKIVGVHWRRGPGWLLPVAGGLLFTFFVVVVLTSAVWYVNEFGLPSGTGGY